MQQKFSQLIDQMQDDIVQVRRHLHMHPELSFQETKTVQYIKDFYDALQIEYQHPIGQNGLVARLKGAKPGKTIALRADFDALPLQDAKDDAPYQSTVPNVMHACGHDGHTSTLLHIAQALHALKDELAGEFVFIHQHAEEMAPGGAIEMVRAGVLDDVDEVYATHLWAVNETGTIECRKGAIMAAADHFLIHVQGHGGHGSAPHLSKDALVIASTLVVQMQQVVSRSVNPLQPAVVTFGKIESGDAFNIIADSAHIEGTVRTFDPETQKLVKQSMARICEAFGEMYECTITLEYRDGYPAVINHDEGVDIVEQATHDLGLNYVECEPYTGGEDFAYFLQEKPGAIFFTGAAIEGRPEYPHHHPKFDIDEQSLINAAKMLGTIAIERAASK